MVEPLGTVKEQLDHFGAARSGESAVKPRACDPPSKLELSKLFLDSSLEGVAKYRGSASPRDARRLKPRAKSAKPGLRRALISLYHKEIIHVVPAPRRRGFVDVARGFQPQGESLVLRSIGYTLLGTVKI